MQFERAQQIGKNWRLIQVTQTMTIMNTYLIVLSMSILVNREVDDPGSDEVSEPSGVPDTILRSANPYQYIVIEKSFDLVEAIKL